MARMCDGKVRYRSEVDAMLARERIAAKGHERGKEPRRQYRCPVCKGWHLTSRDRRAA